MLLLKPVLHLGGSRDADGCLDFEHFEHRRCDIPNRVQEAWPSERNALDLLQKQWVRLSQATKDKYIRVTITRFGSVSGSRGTSGAARMYENPAEHTSV